MCRKRNSRAMRIPITSETASATEVLDFAKRPPRQAGTIVTDEGDGGVKAAEFLASRKFI